MTSTFPPTPPHAPLPAGPPPRSGPSGRLVLAVLGLVVALVAAVAVAIVFLDRATGPDHPDEWDERVAALIPIVEEERGLEFKHPVHVDFRTEDEFRKDMTADEGDLTEEDREEIEQTTALLRALGLVKSDVDLFKELNELTSEGTLGFYSFEDKRIRVRGDELTPAVTSTLVHELTHALQDQHFDLGKRFEEFDESEEHTAASVFRGVVEGDASRVETAYFESLSSEEQDEIIASEEAEQGDMEEKLDQIPQILTVMMGTPYALGEPLVALAVAEDGNEAADEMFRTPPSTEEHLMDPWTWLIDQEPAIEVPQPKLPEGAEEFDSGEFGALFLYFVLAEHIGLTEALDAGDGWGGDHYLAYTLDDVTCITADFVGDTEQDLAEIHSALGAWSDALPDGAATVSKAGDRVRLESCDSGDDSRVGSESSTEALQLVALRAQLGMQMQQVGADAEAARCFADTVVREFSVEQLIDPEFGAEDPKVQQQIQQMMMACA